MYACPVAIGQRHAVTIAHVLVYQQALCDGRQAGEAPRQVLEQRRVTAGGCHLSRLGVERELRLLLNLHVGFLP